ncbi:TPA: hypothetical protein ACWMK0_001186 [Enterobacter mori]
MQRQYHHPLEKGFAERIHTPGGVRSLVEDSHLMTLLRQLAKLMNVWRPFQAFSGHVSGVIGPP